MAIIKNLYIDQGTSYAATITVTDAVLATTLELDDTQIYAQIRKSAFSTNVTAEFHYTYNTNSNELIIFLTDEETAAISPGRYEYDVLVVDANRNSTIKLMGGVITVESTVTKINV